MSEFAVHIKTTADLKAAQDLKASFQDQIKATKALGQDATGLEGQLKKVDAALNSESAHTVRLTDAKNRASEAVRQFGRDTTESARKTESLTAAIGTRLLGAIGGITAGLAAAKRALNEFANAEREVAKLDAALAQTQQLTDANRERLQALASQLQATTAIADDQWLGVLTKLTQFGSRVDAIERDAEAVKNLAGVLGGDLNQAATLVSRALQGNFDMFARYGIEVEKTGTQIERLERLYAQLAQRGGGQLEASSRTLSGRFQQLKNNAGDFFEAIGRGAARTGVLQEVIDKLSTAFGFWASRLGGTIDQVKGLTNAAQASVQSFEDAAQATRKLAEEQEQLKLKADASAMALRNELEALQRITSHKTEVEDAKLALSLAEVDSAEAGGKLNREQAIQQRANLRREAEARKLQIQQEAKEAEINKRSSAMHSGESTLAGVRQQATKAESDLQAAQKIAAERSRVIEKLNQEIQYWEKEMEFFQKAPTLYFNESLGIGQGVSLRRLNAKSLIEEQIRSAQSRFTEQTTALNLQTPAPNVAELSGRAIALRTRANDLDRAVTTENTAHQRRIDQLREEIAMASELFEIRQKTQTLETRTQVASVGRAAESRIDTLPVVRGVATARERNERTQQLADQLTAMVTEVLNGQAQISALGWQRLLADLAAVRAEQQRQAQQLANTRVR